MVEKGGKFFLLQNFWMYVEYVYVYSEKIDKFDLNIVICYFYMYGSDKFGYYLWDERI